MANRKKLYREYDEDGQLIKLECGTCGKIKSIDCFDKCKTKKDGVHTICKACVKEQKKQHYINNKDNILEQKKQYRIINKDKKHIKILNAIFSI